MSDSKDRILIAINQIASETGLDIWSGFDPKKETDRDYNDLTKEQLVQRCESANQALSLIYRFAHVGVNKCGNPHSDWIDQFLEYEKGMIKSNSIPTPKTTDPNPALELPLPENNDES